MPLRPLLAALLLASAGELDAAQPQFWRIEGARDFLDGDAQGLSVDSEGRLRLAPASRVLHDPEVPYVWCLVADRDRVLYAGTGNDGKVYRVEGEKATVFFDAPELEVHALAMGPDRKLYVGTSPDGKVYAVDAKGQSETFYDPSDKYIWALAFDAAGQLFVATGAEGRIHRVDRKGAGEVAFASTETHLLSLAVDGKGNVYAGSAPNGIVYRIGPALDVFVLHDASYREAKALHVRPDGSLYVAAVESVEKEDVTRPPGAPPPPAPTPAAGVTVTESFSIVGPPQVLPSPAPRTIETPRPGAAKGAVLRILPSGEVDTLWSTAEDVPHAIAGWGDGMVVGTGDKGKLFLVRDDRTWSMVAAFPAEQITAFAPGVEGGLFVASSNPGKILALDAGTAERGTFTAKVKDTETVSAWGQVRWEATVPTGTRIEVQTRTGNTASPDSTWSEWSPAYQHKEGDPVTSARARFLQVRALLTGTAGASPLLDAVSVAYLQRNLRPQVQSITVHPPGEVFQKPISVSGEVEVLGLEGGPPADRATLGPRTVLPPATTYSRKLYQKGIQTFTWKAEDPNDDTLTYDVHYRAVGDTRFRPLRSGLTEAVLAWDTTTVPNGRYVVRITASDAPSNPGPLVLASDKESLPFEVDNTPPSVAATLEQRSPIRIRVAATDDSSLIRRTEYSVDGGRWEEVYPLDGINDSLEEGYVVILDPVPGPGPHVVVIRTSDQLGNVATARVETP